jgi:uncharacterized protein (TIGR02646 family)
VAGRPDTILLTPAFGLPNTRSPRAVDARAELAKYRGKHRAGVDIEHFRPKTHYPECMFVWENLLLCCAECGRRKGDRFPLDEGGRHLMIDPTTEDPWLHLDFDPATGNIVARFDLDTNAYSPKGEATVEHLGLDRREALARVYSRGYRRISQAVSVVLEQAEPDVDQLISLLLEKDDNGLRAWCFHGNGRNLMPFSQLRSDFPDVWRHAAVQTQHRVDAGLKVRI